MTNNHEHEPSLFQLPQVDKEIVRELKRQRDEKPDFVDSVIGDMAMENPDLFAHVHDVSNTMPGREKYLFIEEVVLVYSALRRQKELNDLELLFGEPAVTHPIESTSETYGKEPPQAA